MTINKIIIGISIFLWAFFVLLITTSIATDPIEDRVNLLILYSAIFSVIIVFSTTTYKQNDVFSNIFRYAILIMYGCLGVMPILLLVLIPVNFGISTIPYVVGFLLISAAFCYITAISSGIINSIINIRKYFKHRQIT